MASGLSLSSSRSPHWGGELTFAVMRRGEHVGLLIFLELHDLLLYILSSQFAISVEFLTVFYC